MKSTDDHAEKPRRETRHGGRQHPKEGMLSEELHLGRAIAKREIGVSTVGGFLGFHADIA